jgi:hypothetical protein
MLGADGVVNKDPSPVLHVRPERLKNRQSAESPTLSHPFGVSPPAAASTPSSRPCGRPLSPRAGKEGSLPIVETMKVLTRGILLLGALASQPASGITNKEEETVRSSLSSSSSFASIRANSLEQVRRGFHDRNSSVSNLVLFHRKQKQSSSLRREASSRLLHANHGGGGGGGGVSSIAKRGTNDAHSSGAPVRSRSCWAPALLLPFVPHPWLLPSSILPSTGTFK